MAKATRGVLVVIGIGGIGLACARRLVGDRHVFAADASQENLDLAAKSLRDDGHEVEPYLIDVADFESVQQFAKAAARAGKVETVVHTAGIPPAMGSADRILQVNMLGTAHVIEAFEEVVGPGSSMTCISSITRFGANPSPALSKHLATAPKDKLLSSEVTAFVAGDRVMAYSFSKTAIMLRVQAAARAWNARGARINTVSPGIIMTQIVRQQVNTPVGEAINKLIQDTPMGRAGSANEIASVVAFLSGPDASYVTGADLVADGGYTAANQGFSVDTAAGADGEPRMAAEAK